MGPQEPTKAWASTRRALVEMIGQIEGVLPGSIVTRRMRCGKAACAAARLHALRQGHLCLQG